MNSWINKESDQDISPDFCLLHAQFLGTCRPIGETRLQFAERGSFILNRLRRQTHGRARKGPVAWLTQHQLSPFEGGRKRWKLRAAPVGRMPKDGDSQSIQPPGLTHHLGGSVSGHRHLGPLQPKRSVMTQTGRSPDPSRSEGYPKD